MNVCYLKITNCLQVEHLVDGIALANDEGFNCFQFANFMVSISQTYMISIYDNINMKIEHHLKDFVIDENFKITLNIEMDAM